MAFSQRPKPRRERYGADHRARRRAWQQHLELDGPVPCSRCRLPVRCDDDWDLDHEDDGVRYRGPAHRECNRRAGAQRGAAIVNARRAPLRTSRDWT